MTTVYSLVSSLQRTQSDDEKLRLTDELAVKLENNSRGAATLLTAVLNTELPAMVGSYYSAIVRGPFFSKQVTSYKEKDKLRLSVGLAYLQDFERSVADLDATVLKSLFSLLQNRNLDFLVNDISVNFLHMHNGRVSEEHQLEE